jgi:predicted lipid-binding transport protein (Tim44 family)
MAAQWTICGLVLLVLMHLFSTRYAIPDGLFILAMGAGVGMLLIGFLTAIRPPRPAQQVPERGRRRRS